MNETDEPWELPSQAELEQIAANEPKMLNPLVAYFVFEWQKVVFEAHPWGKDQLGIESVVPSYITLHGVDNCMNWLLYGPPKRTATGPGAITIALVELLQ